jgi:hypothetical protein
VRKTSTIRAWWASFIETSAKRNPVDKADQRLCRFPSGRIIGVFLFETAPTDTLTFAAVALTLVAAGCLAALVPAMRAARVDPVATLRAE